MKDLFKFLTIIFGILMIYGFSGLGGDFGGIIFGLPSFIIALISCILWSRERDVVFNKASFIDRAMRIIGMISLLAIFVEIGYLLIK